MLIEIHAIQNHSPSNLNRDDLGAPKTCYFGGALRSRISSQCIKRSIRMSREFQALCGGIRTRQLARLIAEKVQGKPDVQKRAEKILELCGFKPKKAKKEETDDAADSEKSKMLVYTSRQAIEEMAALLQNGDGRTEKQLAADFCALISKHVAVPDMALSGRMLEPDKSSNDLWKELDKTVEAALQVAHAISTHEALPEVDYYVAADDIPGEDAGAGYVDESMFASACFYKYFSINWDKLVENLNGQKELAAHTVGAFIRGAALANPSGKQNSFAAHNPPDGLLIQFADTPTSYANAFAAPVSGKGNPDVISQSVAQLAHYVRDLDTGYGKPQKRFWFSPNLRYPLCVIEAKKTIPVAEVNLKSLDQLIPAVIGGLGFDWNSVQKKVTSQQVAP
ncbi:MAG TPA: type I-E CRISPR-associated protein Cas7/Cse4/CasC [Candidatus Bathyarchaeia archaeon]|nr:type I-E CRISPR-associated protein Cas7/Cse4/CasC [Candidatus Bathyarchaeia archaeon]